MPRTVADLELGLHRQDASRHIVELRFHSPDDDAERAPVRGLALFDPTSLIGLDPEEYGPALTRMVFADPTIAGEYAKILAVAEAGEVLLRLRILIGPSAPELHALKWELLRNPASGQALATDENVLLSRFLGSMDWRPVHLRPKGDLKALVVVANPTDLGNYRPDGRALPPVDVEGEVGRATAALGLIPTVTVVGPSTLDRLIAALRDGYDIVYLVSHGAMIDGEPRLWFEDAEGKSDKVAGNDLVVRLGELTNRPRLIVLASCQSAGAGEDARSNDGGVLAALGPKLAEAGIPAVVAMQGDISMRTVAEMMPVFFREIGRDGQIDRAMAAARGSVRDRLDHWVPALFLRLVSGRIWYVPGFISINAKGGVEEFEGWPALLSHIESGECTPILGSGLTDWLVGPTREVARRWAEMIHFPLASHEREDLPQVAQYLSVIQDESYLWKTLRKTVLEETLRRFGDQIPESVPRHKIDDVLKAAAIRYREVEPIEPHDILARLPLPLYISTNSDGLLADALGNIEVAPGQKKEPRVELCRWNNFDEWPPSIFDKDSGDPDYRPSAAQPLVYQLFGHLAQPESLVLTEDNYFDFLIGATRDNELIPPVIRRMLTKTSLMFLGFRLDEWDFRVLFRSIMSREGSNFRRKYSHVAVQLDPEEGHNLNPERARHYLQRYFQDANINIYWGNVNDFARELYQEWTRWNQKPG